jgi:hypothetical protein
MTVDSFHDHLDRCPRCREAPFNLCAVGRTLILQTMGNESLLKDTSCAHPGCQNPPVDCRCEHHLIDRPGEDIDGSCLPCPHCAWSLVNLWDYDWRHKSVMLIECPNCLKPVDIHRKFSVNKGK